MVLHFMKEDAKETLKTNISTNIHHYQKATPEWVEDYLGKDCFLEYKTEVDNIAFDLSSDKPVSLEWKNAIILHKALASISRVDATDERFWVGLAHKDCWEYMQYRYSRDSRRNSPESIMNRYFFNNGQKRSLYVHTLSRMWWVAESIYDEKNENPYWLMEFFKSDFSTKALILFSNNFMNNKEILIGLLSAIVTLESEGLKIGREVYYDACSYLNIIGGNSILDYYTRDEIYDKIYRRYENLIKKQ